MSGKKEIVALHCRNVSFDYGKDTFHCKIDFLEDIEAFNKTVESEEQKNTLKTA